MPKWISLWISNMWSRPPQGHPDTCGWRPAESNHSLCEITLSKIKEAFQSAVSEVSVGDWEIFDEVPHHAWFWIQRKWIILWRRTGTRNRPASRLPLLYLQSPDSSPPFSRLRGCLQNIPHLVAFAMKANSNLAVLRVLAREGCGADIVSGGELFRALKAGVPPQKWCLREWGNPQKKSNLHWNQIFSCSTSSPRWVTPHQWSRRLVGHASESRLAH